jgi:hypothetical protein
LTRKIAVSGSTLGNGCSKLLPRTFGDKVTVTGDPAAPIVQVAALDLKRLTSVELDALERFADARLAAIDVADRGD